MPSPPAPRAPAPVPRLGRLESILVERGVVTAEAIAAARERQRGAKRPLLEVLTEQGAADEDTLVAAIANALGVPVAPPGELATESDVQGLVSAETVQQAGIVPLRRQGDVLVVATCDPLQLPVFDDIALRTGLRVQPLLAKPSVVRAAIRRARGSEEAFHEFLKHTPAEGLDVEVRVETPIAGDESGGALDVAALASDAPTIRFVNLLIADAARQGASDIHIEAERDAMRVRFRLDGELREILAVPRTLHSPVISRIKIMSGLDIIETRRPQDGRVKVTSDGHEIDLRVSTLPSYFGEKAVLRLLDPSAATFDLARCGLDDDVLVRWRELTRRPHGLLLMTGPTGSGKTSTLFASLLEIRDPSLNVMTVEDPVEYQFPGIVHVPVRSDIGMTFASALRSILRQDPDVVLLGEIRDAETATVALQAAMTGHLVLSTLHTNDAVGAIPRLLDLGVDPQILGSSLLGVMAQRLARTICSACAEPHAYEEHELRALGWRGEPTGQTRRGRGCAACRGSGMKGRTAIAELVVATPALKALVARRATDAELRVQTAADGSRTLAESGLGKVLRGTCAPAEVSAVAAIELTAGPSAAASAAAVAIPAATASPTASSAGSMACSQAPSSPPAPAASARGPASPQTASAVSPNASAIPPGPWHAVAGAVHPATGVQAPRPGAAAGSAATSRSCGDCGDPAESGWRYCPTCGSVLPVPTTGASALVCDDDPLARRLAVLALRGEFPSIAEARDGVEALDQLAVRRPDVLVVDQEMPRMTGIELIRALRSRIEFASLPILMLTACADDDTESASLDAGADDYLRKPVNAARLKARVRALVAARRRWAGSSIGPGTSVS